MSGRNKGQGQYLKIHIMKKFFIIAVSAFLIVACTSKQSNTEQQSVQENDSNVAVVEEIKPADEVATDEVATTEPVAYEAWKKICAVNGVEVKMPCPEGCTVEYTESDEPDEAYFIEDHVGCYPLKSGGWAVIHQRIEAAESTPGFYAYDTYKFDGEKLTEADYLVIPPVDEFLDAQKCVGHEETAAQIKKNYSSRPKDFLTYWINAKEKTIEINLRPLDYESEESTGNFSEAHFDLVKPVVYRWNGERFVK